MAKWIWYDNDFELYHNELLHCRRESEECDYPCMWHLCRPEVSAEFTTKMTAKTDTVVHVYTHGKGMICFGWQKYPANTDIHIKAGEYDVSVQVFDHDGFPAIFIDSEYLKTDESWKASRFDYIYKPVGCEPAFVRSCDNPTVFPFEYERIFPTSQRETDGGTLYDFGREYFGRITLKGIDRNDEIMLVYGESEKEALDPNHAEIREKLCNISGDLIRPCRAFRYIFIKNRLKNNIDFTAEYEYLPIRDIASFSCDDEAVSKIWDMCSYTFHLNSREFYLDGIKRDRWVWSGDAYQSFIVNRYLYNEPKIIKRTIKALLGKPPYTQHINRINDYSALLIIGIYEYYFASGDIDFVRSVWDNVIALYGFITSRLDENGYVVERNGDWIFIDWSDFDKTGAFCAEQILLWQVYKSMSALCAAVGEDDKYTLCAEKLHSNIMRDFWSCEKSAFIDSFSSGKNHITRHAGIFAILFDFVDKSTAEKICETVLCNDEITQITTPYFKLYELMALSKCGKVEKMQKYLDEYWGGMLSLGATTVWEQYNPEDKGDEHFAMYGARFGKSLCHAWGSGPILLLGKYVAGVVPTSIGSKTFTVSPNPGKYKHFDAVVPINDGIVSISYNEFGLSVRSTADGGTLIFGGQKYAIIPGETLTVDKK